MSEELKSQAQQFLIEKCGYAPCKNDAPGGSFDKIVTSCAEFAAQVCEQREKDWRERADSIATQRDGAVIGLSARQNQFERMGDLADTAIEDRDAWKQRAEAAELALQIFKEDVAKADKAAVKAMKLVEAQARQQAIAETREECAKLVETTSVMHEKAHYSAFSAPSRDAERLAAKIRSLTPPPALTPCIHGDDPAACISCEMLRSRPSKVAPPALTKEK